MATADQRGRRPPVKSLIGRSLVLMMVAILYLVLIDAKYLVLVMHGQGPFELPEISDAATVLQRRSNSGDHNNHAANVTNNISSIPRSDNSEIQRRSNSGVHNNHAANVTNNISSNPRSDNLEIQRQHEKDLEEFHQRAGNATRYPHQIPHRTIFIHTLYERPSDMKKLLYDNIRNTHRIFAEFWNELAPLWFLREKDCRIAVELAEPKLLPSYLNETRGNNKANLCRVAALYLKGGYYFDVDMGTIRAVPLSDNTTFAVPHEYLEPARNGNKDQYLQGLFNSFLAVTPGHPVLRKNLDLYIDHYNGMDLPVRSKHHHLGTGSLRLAYKATNQTFISYMKLVETLLTSKMSKLLNLPFPKGEGWGCNFYVSDPEKQVAYFWSRIPGYGVGCKLPDETETA